MKFLLTAIVMLFLPFLLSAPSLAFTGGENYIWVSEDLGVSYSKIGYLHQDQKFIKVTSETTNGGLRSSFDLSFGSDILSFGDSLRARSGLYGEVGVNSSSGLSFLFGTGIKYISSASNFMLSAGTKYYIREKRLVYDAMAFIRVLPPLTLNFGYDDLYRSKIFIGLGLQFK